MAIRQAHACWEGSPKEDSGKVDFVGAYSLHRIRSKALAGTEITLETALRAT
jgi:hypothetical protein